MTREQRLRYEMLDRARTFWNVNRDAFPETTAGGQAFAQVAEAVAAVEAHMAQREQARADARKVKVATRMAVTQAMKAIAATGRRVTVGETSLHPFRMPTRKSAAAVLSKARHFLAAAEQRRERFVAFGMAPTFLADFRTLIDDLAEAIRRREGSRATRRQADDGLTSALARGFTAIQDLDVAVANTLAGETERLAAWAGARHIDGQGASRDKRETSAPVEAEATPGSVEPPVMEKAS